MGISSQIEQILTESIKPERLQVINESHLHAGHAGDDGSGESHFRVYIVADRFDGLSRIERHRLVHDALGQSLPKMPHALSIKALTPAEAEKQKINQ